MPDESRLGMVAADYLDDSVPTVVEEDDDGFEVVSVDDYAMPADEQPPGPEASYSDSDSDVDVLVNREVTDFVHDEQDNTSTVMLAD